MSPQFPRRGQGRGRRAGLQPPRPARASSAPRRAANISPGPPRRHREPARGGEEGLGTPKTPMVRRGSGSGQGEPAAPGRGVGAWGARSPRGEETALRGPGGRQGGRHTPEMRGRRERRRGRCSRSQAGVHGRAASRRQEGCRGPRRRLRRAREGPCPHLPGGGGGGGSRRGRGRCGAGCGAPARRGPARLSSAPSGRARRRNRRRRRLSLPAGAAAASPWQRGPGRPGSAAASPGRARGPGLPRRAPSSAGPRPQPCCEAAHGRARGERQRGRNRVCHLYPRERPETVSGQV